MSFVSLHNHTSFSLLDALSTPKELLSKAKELGQTAIAITEHGSFASVWESYKLSKDIGIKLIVGCEYYFVNSLENKNNEIIKHIILLAKNLKGYQNLLQLNREGFNNNIVKNGKVTPIIDWSLLEKYSKDTICLTACAKGIIGQPISNRNFEEANNVVEKLINIFGKDNLGLEVQTHTLSRSQNQYHDKFDQRLINHYIIKTLAPKYGLKIIPTTNSHYINKDDAQTHDVLLAIGAKQPVFSGNRLKYSDQSEFYVKSYEEVRDFFGRNYNKEFGENFAESLCQNTIDFANMCEQPEWVNPKFTNPSGKELADFPVEKAEDYKDYLNWVINQNQDVQNLAMDKSYLRYKCEIGLKNKCPKGKEKEYQERLDEELDVIEFQGLSSYMLIVADYLEWARKNGISIGPGRGSCGGSIIAYFLDIHKADSIKYGLIFARFQNKMRMSMADIDIDIAPSGRDRVKQYLIEKYGADHICHVSNVNTITPKVYARDLARSCQLGGSREEAVIIGNSAADSIPAEIKKVEKALNPDYCPLFVEYAKQYKEFDQHKLIGNKYRAWSTHAGGFIISKRPLTNIVPTRVDKDGSIAVEYEKNSAEENGLVKMDILGLNTLDLITATNKLIEKAGKQVPVIDVDKYDQKTYDLISAGNTFCVFQLGTSGGTIDLCKKIKPKTLEDISCVNSLARPASKEIRQPFCDTKNGKIKQEPLHQKLKKAFGDTYGFGLYEEALLYLAQDVAGWNLHKADGLRKLTKDKGKNPEKVAKLREDFIEDAVKFGTDREFATHVWDDIISDFGSYSFNKSLESLEIINTYDFLGNFKEAKAIKNVVSGDYVMSRDEKTMKNIFVKVINNHDHGKQRVVQITLDDGSKIKCTMNHKFRVKETGQMLPLYRILREKLSIVVDIAKMNI